MARLRAQRTSQAKNGDDHEVESPSLRRTSRQPKLRIKDEEVQLALVADGEADVDDDSGEDQGLEESTTSSPRSTTKQLRRSTALTESPDKVDIDDFVSEAEPQVNGEVDAKVDTIDDPEPEPEKKKGRRGGNKRKADYEYCLTCTRYGRACSGRREGEAGCAVCREPNREKGEKLRECLWADPERGIRNYEDAAKIMKQAKAEKRAERRRTTASTKRTSATFQAISRPLPLNGTSSTYSPVTAAIYPPDPLGLVPHPNANPPPLRRPLDVVPPGVKRTGFPIPPPANIDDLPYRAHFTHDTAGARFPPGVHRPLVSHICSDGVELRLPNTDAQYVIYLDETFSPYFDAATQAYILPTIPNGGRFALPPEFRQKQQHEQTYISPYDARPPEVLIRDDVGTQRPHTSMLSTVGSSIMPQFSTSSTAPANGSFNVLPPGMTSASSTPGEAGLQAIATSPTKKGSKNASKVSTVGGYDFNARNWRTWSGSMGNGDVQEEKDTIVVNTNRRGDQSGRAQARSNRETLTSGESSPLSTATEMADSSTRREVGPEEETTEEGGATTGPETGNDQNVDTTHETMATTHASRLGVAPHPRQVPPRATQDYDDRLEGILQSVARENGSLGLKRKRSPTSTRPQPAQFTGRRSGWTAVNGQSASSRDAQGGSDDGDETEEDLASHKRGSTHSAAGNAKLTLKFKTNSPVSTPSRSSKAINGPSGGSGRGRGSKGRRNAGDRRNADVVMDED